MLDHVDLRSVEIGQSQQIQWSGVPIASDVATSISLIIALVALIMTFKSIRISHRATILSNLPVLTLRFRDETGDFILKNTGKGPAYKISISYAISHIQDRLLPIDNVWRLQLEAVRNVLEIDSEIALRTSVYDHDSDSRAEDTGTVVDFMVAGDGIKAYVCFEDLMGHRYVTYLGAGRMRSVIITPPREYTTIWAIAFNITSLSNWFRYQIFMRMRSRQKRGNT